MKEILALINNHLSEKEYKFEDDMVLRKLTQHELGILYDIFIPNHDINKVYPLTNIKNTVNRLLKIHGIPPHNLFYHFIWETKQ